MFSGGGHLPKSLIQKRPISDARSFQRDRSRDAGAGDVRGRQRPGRRGGSEEKDGGREKARRAAGTDTIKLLLAPQLTTP